MTSGSFVSQMLNKVDFENLRRAILMHINNESLAFAPFVEIGAEECRMISGYMSNCYDCRPLKWFLWRFLSENELTESISFVVIPNSIKDGREKSIKEYRLTVKPKGATKVTVVRNKYDDAEEL